MTQNWLNTEVIQINSTFLLIAVDMGHRPIQAFHFYLAKISQQCLQIRLVSFHSLWGLSESACLEFQEQPNTSHSDIREAKHSTSGFSATNSIWQFYSFSHTTSESSNPKWLGFLFVWLVFFNKNRQLHELWKHLQITGFQNAKINECHLISIQKMVCLNLYISFSFHLKE